MKPITISGNTREQGAIINAQVKKFLLDTPVVELDFCNKIVANTGFFDECFRGIEPNQVLLKNICKGDFWLLTDVYPNEWKKG